MLYYSLKSLDKLDVAKEAECLAKAQIPIITSPSTSKVAIPNDFLNLELAVAHAAYDFLNPFQVTLDFISEMP